jgi:hypothetical protein
MASVNFRPRSSPLREVAVRQLRTCTERRLCGGHSASARIWADIQIHRFYSIKLPIMLSERPKRIRKVPLHTTDKQL